MTEKIKQSTPSRKAAQDRCAPMAKPDWANGLRRLYDSVVEEPLPDSFMDLLSKLDDAGQ